MVRLAHRRALYFRDWHSLKPTLWDGLIDLCSGGNPIFPGHCHTEILFENGHSFTSTTLADPETVIYKHGRPRGPLFRRIEFKPGEWDFTPLHLTDSQTLQLYRACEELIDESVQAGGGYDYAGVLRFVLPFLKEHKRDWFCTEACVDRLQTVGYFQGLKPSALSPNEVFDECKKLTN